MKELRLSNLIGKSVNIYRICSIFLPLVLLFLSSCASKAPSTGYYKVGKPYQVEGKWYEPKQQADYDETGMASWYGSEFHKKETANGGKFDKNILSAAHKTLPLPSMVKVTNLANNKTLILMVNDRGPFSNNRIFDVSERAAEILGFKDKGVTNVRVQYLPGQTKRLLADLPGTKGEKQAEERAFATSKKPFNIASSVGKAESDMSPVSKLSRVFTSTANESEVKEVPNVAEKNSSISSEDKILAVKAKKLSATEDNNTGASDTSPVVPAKLAQKGSGASKEVQYIQAGTYGVKANAQRVQKNLAAIGDVNIIPVQINGKNLYKVKLGPIMDKKIADLSLQKVIVLGHPDAILVKETALVAE